MKAGWREILDLKRPIVIARRSALIRFIAPNQVVERASSMQAYQIPVRIPACAAYGNDSETRRFKID
jgi:hypothetical protein